MARLNLKFINFFTTILIAGVVQAQESLETTCATLDANNNSVPGFCINIKTQLKSCPPHYDLLKKKDWVNLRKHICSYDNKRVCCPVTNFNEISVDEEKRINAQDYSQHPNFKHLPPIRMCGLSFHSTPDRIINGVTSLPGEFPWVARIGVQIDDLPGVVYSCGGSIISKRYILTAGHCFKYENTKLKHVRLGQSDEDKAEECIELANRRSIRQVDEPGRVQVACAKPSDIPHEELIVHPGYTKMTGSNDDIALIRLASDIDLTSFFTKPICLPFLTEYHVKSLEESNILRDKSTLVAGFGKVHIEEQVGSTTLQYTHAPIQPNIMCRISYPTFNVTQTQICAGGIAGTGSCLGDSGGPLFMPAVPEKGSRSIRSFQLGIVSFGKTKCAQGDEPIVYTKVRSHLNWILDNIRE